MTHYELLGISPEATREEIKQAYRKRALETHPDLRRGRPAEIKQASRQFVRISKAYKALIDPKRRVKYDNKLHQRATAAAAKATGHRVVNRGRRIIPPTPPAPAQPARVREDLREIDRLRRQIWREPRKVLVRRFILSLVLLAALAIGNYYALFQDSDAYLPVFRVTFGVGLIVAYGAWLRFSRIWTGSEPVAFLSTDLRPRKTRRRRIPDWANPFWLLGVVALLGIAGVSSMTILGFGEVEPSMIPASVVALVVSLVALSVLCWRAFSRR